MQGTSVERLARMEVEVTELKRSFEEHKTETKATFTEINEKLDSLLALRNKGAGAFWFLSLVFGSAGVLGIINLLHWLGMKV